MSKKRTTDTLQALSRIFGPVFWSEMVTTARRYRYFALRIIFAAAMLFCLWCCYMDVGWSSYDGQLDVKAASRLAAAFFFTFAWLALICTLLVAPAITAGTISTERERRTIEYLFATDLSNAEIVCSKLLSKLLLIGKLILVAVPVLAIFRIMGGIPGDLLKMFFFGLASTACFLATVSLCISVWSPRARDSIIRVYLFLIVLLIVLPAVLGMLVYEANIKWLSSLLHTPTDWLLAINPLYVLGIALDTSGGLGINFDPTPIKQMVVAHLGLSLLFAIVAVASVRRVHLHTISSGEKEKKKILWTPPRYRPGIGLRPMVWKEMFAKTAATKLGLLGRICLALVMVSVVGLAIWMFFYVIFDPPQWGGRGPGWHYLEFSLSITVLMCVIILLLMGLRSASLISYEKERDCWLSLISSPLTGAEIVWAKVVGNLYAFRWMGVPIAVVWLFQLLLTPSFLFTIPFTTITFGAVAVFATALGLAYSIRFDSSLKSIAATLGTLFFAGGGYILCCCMPFMIAGPGDESIILGFFAFVPLLLAVPGIIFEWSLRDYSYGSDEHGYMIFAYLVGTAGFSFVGILLLGGIISHFDSLVGRTSIDAVPVGPKPEESPPPTVSASSES